MDDQATTPGDVPSREDLLRQAAQHIAVGDDSSRHDTDRMQASLMAIAKVLLAQALPVNIVVSQEDWDDMTGGFKLP